MLFNKKNQNETLLNRIKELEVQNANLTKDNNQLKNKLNNESEIKKIVLEMLTKINQLYDNLYISQEQKYYESYLILLEFNKLTSKYFVNKNTNDLEKNVYDYDLTLEMNLRKKSFEDDKEKLIIENSDIIANGNSPAHIFYRDFGLSHILETSDKYIVQYEKSPRYDSFEKGTKERSNWSVDQNYAHCLQWFKGFSDAKHVELTLTYEMKKHTPIVDRTRLYLNVDDYIKYFYSEKIIYPNSKDNNRLYCYNTLTKVDSELNSNLPKLYNKYSLWGWGEFIYFLFEKEKLVRFNLITEEITHVDLDFKEAERARDDLWWQNKMFDFDSRGKGISCLCNRDGIYIYSYANLMFCSHYKKTPITILATAAYLYFHKRMIVFIGQANNKIQLANYEGKNIIDLITMQGKIELKYVIDDWVYYICDNDNYRINIDGSRNTRITEKTLFIEN